MKALNDLKDHGFEVRAITRNPDSETAKAIEPFVKEIAKADGDDEESMVQAFKGCYGAFIVTNFWQDMDVAHEMKTLRTIKDALKKVQLKHVVLSTLDNTIDFVEKAENKDTWKVLNDDPTMYVPHFDGKGIVTKEYFDEGINVTALCTSFYYENFINFGMGPAQHDPSQPHAITFPLGKVKMPFVAVTDIGKYAANLFTDPSTIGATVGVASEHLTGDEMAEAFTKICGYKVVYNEVPTEVYAGFGFPGAEDLANMFRFYVENVDEFRALRPLDVCETRTGGTTKFETWLEENKVAFELKKE